MANNDRIGKIPPQAVDVEKAVLGQLMVDKYAYDEISEMFKPDIFYNEKNKYIAQSIENLKRNNIEIDMVSVADDLNKNSNLELIGGALYLSDITQKVSSASNIEHHIKIIIDQYMKREMIRICSENERKAYDTSVDVGDLIDKFQSESIEISTSFETTKESSVSDIIRKINSKFNSPTNKIDYVKTPFSEVNNSLNGFGNTELIILAARPSMGKTALALYMAVEMAKKGNPVAFFTLEMSKEQMVMRIISILTDIPVKKLGKANISNNVLNQAEWKQYDDAFKIIDQLPIYIDSTPAISYIQMKSKLRRLKRSKGIKICFVDYLQLMTSDNKKDEDYQRISKVSKNLKQTAMELDLPIVALSQLSRDIEKRPKNQQTGRLSDLRGAGDLEQDADVVIFWVNFDILGLEEFYDDNVKNKGLFDIQKSRNGKTSAFYLNVSHNKMRYGNNVSNLPF